MTAEWNLWDDAPAAGEDGTGDKGKNKASECSGGVGGAVDPRERHKLAERERRKSMRELFLSLHSLLPHSSTVRKEQSTILDEVIKYIPLAATRLRALESRRQLMPSAAADRSNQLTSSSYSPYSSNDPANDVAVAASSASPRKRTRTCSGGGGGGGGGVGGDGDGGFGDQVDCNIRVGSGTASSVAIRKRGDRVNVSVTDSVAGSSQASLLSAILDELEAHQLDLVRSTHCRDGGKLLHHSENKLREEVDRTAPALLKARLQELAGKLHGMRKPPPPP